MLIIIAVGIIITFSPVFEVGVVGDSFISFYIFQYALSLIENWEKLNLPIPDGLRRYLDEKNEKLNDFEEYNRRK